MADVSWIKITTDMFDNRKIKHLRRLPDGNNVVLIWVMLLTMAGRCNANGMIFLTENIPYTPKMLADELDFEENTVQLALSALKQLNMIVTDGSYFSIAGWGEYQNIEGMDKIREQTRKRVAKYRKNQKSLPCNVTSNDTVTDSNATDEDKDKEIDKEEDKELVYIPAENGKDLCPVSYKSIQSLYNRICVSFPKCTTLSDARKKAIKARLSSYTVDDFKTVFEKAEASSFLKGGNDRNWQANFDWMIKDSNFAKILDGNYDKKAGRKEVVPQWLQNNKNAQQSGDISWMKQYTKTTKDDPELAERAERLKQSLSG